METNTVIGILSGSVATLIVKGLWEQLTKWQDFQRELKKLTFSRKLEKAENAIALYRTYTNKLIELKKSIELTISVFEDIDESDKDLQIASDLIGKNGIFLGELASEKYAHINAIHLYFELDETENWNEDDLEKLLNAISRMGTLNTELKFWSDNQNKADAQGDLKASDFYWQKMKECIPTYVSKLRDFIDVVERSRLATEEMVRKIKMQVKLR
jgi:hypothetical protein